MKDVFHLSFFLPVAPSLPPAFARSAVDQFTKPAAFWNSEACSSVRLEAGSLALEAAATTAHFKTSPERRTRRRVVPRHG
jgi:hypothetical protein